MVTHRPATEDDFKALGERLRATVFARAFVCGDALAAVAGYYLREGQVLMFANITEQAREGRGFRVAVLRFAREVMEEASRLGMPIIALADPEVPRSAQFLEHLGFRHQQGEVYRHG